MGSDALNKKHVLIGDTEWQMVRVGLVHLYLERKTIDLYSQFDSSNTQVGLTF